MDSRINGLKQKWLTVVYQFLIQIDLKIEIGLNEFQVHPNCKLIKFTLENN